MTHQIVLTDAELDAVIDALKFKFCSRSTLRDDAADRLLKLEMRLYIGKLTGRFPPPESC